MAALSPTQVQQLRGAVEEELQTCRKEDGSFSCPASIYFLLGVRE
jgi:hypothetical protein